MHAKYELKKFVNQILTKMTYTENPICLVQNFISSCIENGSLVVFGGEFHEKSVNRD